MARDRAPVARVAHAVDQRAVAAGRLAEDPAMVAVGERAELPIDERYQLAREVVGITSDALRVDVLVAAERGEAIGEDDDARSHLALGDEPRGALRHVLVETLPGGVRLSGSGKADEIEKHGIALAAPGPAAFVVARRQPYLELAHVW